MSEIAPGAPGTEDYRDMLRRLRILVVGGGAIGQVFGAHLRKGGAEVSYFLKPQYAEDAREGWEIHHYGLSGLRPRQHLKPTEVFTDHRHLRTRSFDQIWLCVSSPALRTGVLEALHSSCPNAVWVSFQPGLEDREYLAQRVPSDKLVVGLVNFIAYMGPLKGEELWPAGIAYFIPPFTMTQFTGPEPYASAVANLLQTGGMKAGVRPDTVEMARYGSSVLIPFVVALECSGWSWSLLRNNGALRELMVQSIVDIQTAIEKATGVFAGSFGMGTKPFAWSLGLFAAPKLATFPLEEYFKYHFTKVREQSDQMVDDFAQLCRDNAIIPRALETLRDQWRLRRGPVQGAPQTSGQYEAPPRQTVREAPAPNPAPAPAPVNTDANHAIHPSTGANPAVGALPPQPDKSAIEPTRPMSIDGPTSKPAGGPVSGSLPAAPAPAAPKAPIEVDFDFDGGEPGPIEIASELLTPEVSEEGVEDDEIFASAGAASHRRELPELNVEFELEPLPEPAEPKPAPVLRTLADLDNIPAIGDQPPEPEPEPEPSVAPKPGGAKPLPFAVDDEEVPSVVVDSELETDDHSRPDMQTIRQIQPGPVHFRDAVPDDEQQQLRRQDFIQTEFANEQQNADLRNLKNKLRARLDSKRSMSPALDDDD